MRHPCLVLSLALIAGACADVESPTAVLEPREPNFALFEEEFVAAVEHEHENETVYIEGMPLIHPCTFETIIVDGRIHFVSKTTLEDGSVREQLNSQEHYRGISAVTGERYLFIATQHQDVTGDPLDPTKATIINNFHVISLGPSPDFYSRARTIIRLDGTEPRVVKVDFESDCR